MMIQHKTIKLIYKLIIKKLKLEFIVSYYNPNNVYVFEKLGRNTLRY